MWTLGTTTMALLTIAAVLWLGLSTRRRLRRLVVAGALGVALLGLPGLAIATLMFGPGAIRERAGYYGGGPGPGPPIGGPGRPERPARGDAGSGRPTDRGWRPSRDPLRCDATVRWSVL